MQTEEMIYYSPGVIHRTRCGRIPPSSNKLESDAPAAFSATLTPYQKKDIILKKLQGFFSCSRVISENDQRKGGNSYEEDYFTGSDGGYGIVGLTGCCIRDDGRGKVKNCQLQVQYSERLPGEREASF